MKLKVSILGAGWLGSALGENLVAQGHTVLASTTTPEKMPILSGLGMQPYLMDLASELDWEGKQEFFQVDTLVVCLPPTTYEGRISAIVGRIIGWAEKGGCKRILLISSISVYPDDAGEVSRTDIEPITARGRSVREIEEAFETCWPHSIMIIRMGGLFGPNRHPGRFLAGKQNLPGGNQPVNMIHLSDCLGILNLAIRLDTPNGIYHAVAPEHPTRQDFYTQAALLADLPVPTFGPDEMKKGKTINPIQLCQYLNYTFQFPNPITAISEC